jgi:hypothetical protein
MATLTSRIKLAEFSSLPTHETKQRVDDLVRGSVSPSPELLEEQRKNLDDQIRLMEEQHGLSSEKMRHALKNGAIQETADICRWLMLLEIRDDFEKAI